MPHFFNQPWARAIVLLLMGFALVLAWPAQPFWLGLIGAFSQALAVTSFWKSMLMLAIALLGVWGLARQHFANRPRCDENHAFWLILLLLSSASVQLYGHTAFTAWFLLALLAWLGWSLSLWKDHYLPSDKNRLQVLPLPPHAIWNMACFALLAYGTQCLGWVVLALLVPMLVSWIALTHFRICRREWVYALVGLLLGALVGALVGKILASPQLPITQLMPWRLSRWWLPAWGVVALLPWTPFCLASGFEGLFEGLLGLGRHQKSQQHQATTWLVLWLILSVVFSVWQPLFFLLATIPIFAFWGVPALSHLWEKGLETPKAKWAIDIGALLLLFGCVWLCHWMFNLLPDTYWAAWRGLPGVPSIGALEVMGKTIPLLSAFPVWKLWLLPLPTLGILASLGALWLNSQPQGERLLGIYVLATSWLVLMVAQSTWGVVFHGPRFQAFTHVLRQRSYTQNQVQFVSLFGSAALVPHQFPNTIAPQFQETSQSEWVIIPEGLYYKPPEDTHQNLYLAKHWGIVGRSRAWWGVSPQTWLLLQRNKT